jgi:(2S)-methylsuccinyl-CoA dehydrogenase
MSDRTLPSPVLSFPDLLPITDQALAGVESVLAAARQRLRAVLAPEGRLDPEQLDHRQFATHGFAWLATYATALREMRRWAGRLADAERFGTVEALILQIAFGEYLAQINGGIALAQGEIARAGDLGLEPEDLAPLRAAAPARLIRDGNTAAARSRLGQMLADGLESGEFGALGIDDPTLDLVRTQFRRFGAERVQPH